MTADLVVSGGRVGGAVRDVVVADGGIVAVTEPGQSGPSTRVIDADGVVVMAGAVDAHVHFDEPGRTEWEGWAAGSLAAAAGGVTTVVDMPIDSDPPTIDADAVAAKRAAATSSSLVDFALWGGLVPGNAGALEALLDAGVVGLKAFLCDSGWTDFPPCTGDALDSGMRAAAAARVPVAVHCEDPSYFGPEGQRPLLSEVAAVARAGAAAAARGAALHVVHCSSADAVLEAGRWPRTTVETCPHYLVLTEEDAEHIGSDAMCCPPVRDDDNRHRLLELTAGGAVHSIASDHSPCPASAKEDDPPFAGVAGVETTLSVLLSLPSLTLEQVERLRTAAARLCGLGSKGAVAPGYDADLVLVDLNSTWEVRPDSLHSRHRRSPFTGRTLPGVVVATLVRGTVVYEHGVQAADPAGRDASSRLALTS